MALCQNGINPASGHTARDGAVSKPSQGRMSINGSKTAQSGAPGRIGLILQSFSRRIQRQPAALDARGAVHRRAGRKIV